MHVQKLLLELGAGFAFVGRQVHAEAGDVKKPIGAAEWQTRLVESLPEKPRGSLPSIENIERVLNKPMQNRA